MAEMGFPDLDPILAIRDHLARLVCYPSAGEYAYTICGLGSANVGRRDLHPQPDDPCDKFPDAH